MTDTATIASVLVDFLQSAPGIPGPVDMETNLIESGLLDSLLVLDLVCFLETRFQIKMQPADINSQNLQSARRLAEFVSSTSACGAEAA